MGPILICDKSTLQSLNPSELNALRRYFLLNIPPVQLVEILGDLKKRTDFQAGQDEVRILANKLMPACSTVNTSFRKLIRGELSGHTFPMDGRPVLSDGNNVESPEGKRGIVFDITSEAEALLRWQTGKFHEAESFLAEAWKLSTQALDLENLQRQLKGEYSGKLKLKSLTATAEFVDDLMNSAPPDLLLAWFLQDIGMFGEKSQRAIIKFRDSGLGTLNAKTPYTAYCVRTALIFHFALAFSLISTRPTNRIDLEYFFYTPFCMVFSSGDAFHHQIASLVLRNQIYVTRDELKSDLKNLAEWWKHLSPEQQQIESSLQGPPENENSKTHQIWKKFMKPGFRDPERLAKHISPETSAKLLKQFQEVVKKSTPSNKAFDEASDDCEFMVVKHMVRADGPCICGSERMFKDCCGKKITGSS